MASNLPDKFVTIEDLANIFAVSVSTARAWVRTGAIPKHTYIKIGHTYRFNLPRVVEALTEQVESQKQEEAVDDSVIVDEEVKDMPEQLELDLDNLDLDADA